MSSYSYGGYAPYVSVGEKKRLAAKSLDKLRKKNPDISPVIIEGRNIANNWWGISWNQNLECYADYANRIGRGRSYVKSGAVLDLRITKGLIEALVQGSGAKPYSVKIIISPLQQKTWNSLIALCNRRVDTMEALLAGEFPKDLTELFTQKQGGLFPAPGEITLSCSCPDGAVMCKHVAAVLYGVGARLDKEPQLFFTLRDIDFTALMKKSIQDKTESMLKNAGKRSPRTIEEERTGSLFGV